MSHLKSRPYDTFITRPLTDRAIDRYIRKGVYGKRLQDQLLARDKAKKKKVRLSSKPKTNLLDLNELADL